MAQLQRQTGQLNFKTHLWEVFKAEIWLISMLACACFLPAAAAESAAALAKARKKLLKIQGIASQADKAHSSVIVDLGVLAGEAAAGEEQAAAQGRGQASNATSIAAGRSSESVGPREKRSSKQGAAAGTAPAAGELQALKLQTPHQVLAAASST